MQKGLSVMSADSISITQVVAFLITLYGFTRILGREFILPWLVLATIFIIPTLVGAYVFYGYMPVSVLLLKAKIGARVGIPLAVFYGLIGAVLINCVALALSRRRVG